MYKLTVSGNFAAAHSIPTFPEGHKCRNIHGHTWEVEVTYFFNEIQKEGFCFDFGKLKVMLADILSRFDHGGQNNQTLNEIINDIPTAENLSSYIYHALESYTECNQGYGNLIGRKREVKVKESSNAWVIYDGK